MPTIAYIANVYPAPSEPYVGEEIAELRSRGMNVVACSIRRNIRSIEGKSKDAEETLYVWPLKLSVTLAATWLLVKNVLNLRDFLARVFLQRREPPLKRIKALAHTWLGAYLTILLAERNIDHIHVHHGYFGSWVAMVASRLLGTNFSMTLHGSDLLLHPSYLDIKLKECSACYTISDFNRRHILTNHPSIDPHKILVHRMGVECPDSNSVQRKQTDSPFVMLSVGRLHPVKDHRFLLLACRLLKQNGLRFVCWIAGDGAERPALEKMIVRLGLTNEVTLLGQVAHHDLAGYYDTADLLVLTSRSEGIPLVLMEAMARGAVVLAPAITGIPELVIHDETGFLYQPGSLDDFASQVQQIQRMHFALDGIRHAARQHVFRLFDRDTNLAALCDSLLLHLKSAEVHRHGVSHSLGLEIDENPVLQ